MGVGLALKKVVGDVVVVVLAVVAAAVEAGSSRRSRSRSLTQSRRQASAWYVTSLMMQGVGSRVALSFRGCCCIWASLM